MMADRLGSTALAVTGKLSAPDAPVDETGTSQLPERRPSPRTRPASFAFIQSRLRRLNLRAGDEDAPALSPAAVKGPLGLNILHEPAEPQIDFIFVRFLL